MKTLKDLKQTAHKYEWSLISNSWYQNVPSQQAEPRRVGRVATQRMTLLTVKNGENKESWLDFPKASELSISHYGLSTYKLTITKPNDNREPHVMVYMLKPIIDFFQKKQA